MTFCDPGVSVIIPAYKAAAFIGETLQSVFNQTVLPQEVIVVNDGSPDTPELERALEPFRDRIIYIVQENKGVSGARNTAIRASSQPLLACIDSDDLWKPAYLEVQTRYLREHPDVDLVYPNGVKFGDSPDAGKIFMEASPSNGDVTFEKLVRLECNVNTSVTVRREAVLKAGLYDESLKTSEDFDLWLRIHKMGGRIAYHREILMMSRGTPGSLSSQQMQMYNDFLQVLAKAEATLHLTPSEQEAIHQQRRDYRARIALQQGKSAFFHGNPQAAIDHLRAANTYFESKKLTISILLLRIAPSLLLKLYHLRDALVFRTDTKSRYVNS